MTWTAADYAAASRRYRQRVKNRESGYDTCETCGARCVKGKTICKTCFSKTDEFRAIRAKQKRVAYARKKLEKALAAGPMQLEDSIAEEAS
jgi:uncharacterized OB-fold protein